MEAWEIIQLVNQFVPQKYQPLLVVALAVFVAFEQWLAATNRIRANSTLQAAVDLCRAVVEKMRGGAGTGR
jgi:putative copper export protein